MGFIEWASAHGLESLSLDSAADRARLAELIARWLQSGFDNRRTAGEQWREAFELKGKSS